MTLTHNPCLFCYGQTAVKPTQFTNNIFYNFGDENCSKSLLDEEISAVFILREILEVPASFCENLLKNRGNPSEWFQCCILCKKVTERAKATYKKLAELMKELKLIRQIAHQILLNSIGSKQTYRINKLEFGLNKAVDQIRDFVFDGDKQNPLSNQVAKDGILANLDLDFNVVIKEEIVEECTNELEDFKVEIESDEHDDQMDIKLSIDEHSFDETLFDENPIDDNPIDENGLLSLDGQIENTNSEKISVKKRQPQKRRGKTKRRIKTKVAKNSSLKCKVDQNTEDVDENGLVTLDEVAKNSDNEVVRQLRKRTKKTGKGRKNTDDGEEGSSPKDGSDSEWENEDDYTKYMQCIADKFKCKICDKAIYSRKDSLSKHIRQVHKKITHHNCKICEEKFFAMPNLRNHYRKFHPEMLTVKDIELIIKAKAKKREKKICPQCGRTVVQLYEHIQIMHPKDDASSNFECKICNKTFVFQHQLNRHNRGKHYKELDLLPFQCTECDKIFAGSNKLKRHRVTMHTKDFDFFCEICNSGIYSARELEKHMKVVHNIDRERFFCEHCGKEYFTSSHLKDHIVREHTKDFQYKCEVCDKQFASKEGLKNHVKLLHSGEPKGIVCELCGFSCSIKANLLYHQRGHHYKELGLEPYQCSYCQKIFTAQRSVDMHINGEHKNEWKYFCQVDSCEGKFQTKSALELHILSKHTGERPFPCTFCQLRFFNNSSLKKHMQFHTKNFSFNCDLCSKGFSDRSNFTRHMKQVHKIDNQ